MTKLRLKPQKPKKSKHLKRASIDDPILSAEARALMRAALTMFAESIPRVPGGSEADQINAVIELWEFGYLRGVAVGDGVMIEPCLPHQAPQLRTGTRH